MAFGCQVIVAICYMVVAMVIVCQVVVAICYMVVAMVDCLSSGGCHGVCLFVCQVLPTVPHDQRTRVAHFLEKQGFKQQALAVSTDIDHK